MAAKRDRALADNGNSPKVIRLLSGGIPLREPWPAELDFFQSRPDVKGMAAEDGAVVLNPYSALSDLEMCAVALNEAARIFMIQHREHRPTFELTDKQKRAFFSYGPEDAVKETIAARILSGDPSALDFTPEQLAFVDSLRTAMKSKG